MLANFNKMSIMHLKHLLSFIAVLLWFNFHLTAQELIPFLKNDLYGFSDTLGNMVIPCRYQEVKWFGQNNFTFVRDSSHWHIIDITGRLLPGFRSEALPILHVFKTKYTDEKKNIINRLVRDSATLHLWALELDDMRWAVFNSSDFTLSGPYFVGGYSEKSPRQLRTSIPFLDHLEMEYGLKVVEKDKYKMNLIDLSGREILKEDRQKIVIAGPGRLGVFKDSLAALTTMDGTPLTPFCFSDIWRLTDSLYIVSNFRSKVIDGKHKYGFAGVISKDGDIVIDTAYIHFTPFNEQYLIAKKDKTYGVFSSLGSIVIPFEYHLIHKLSAEEILVCRDSFINIIYLRDGKFDQESGPNIHLPFRCDRVFKIGSYFKVRSDTLEGLVSLEGKVAIPFEWEFIEGLTPNLFKGVNAEGSYVLDTEGKIVAGPFWSQLSANKIRTEEERYLIYTVGEALMTNGQGQILGRYVTDGRWNTMEPQPGKGYLAAKYQGKVYYVDPVTGRAFRQ